MHPFITQDIASPRVQEFRAAAERATLVSQAKAARRRHGHPSTPGGIRREIGWWLVGAGLRLAVGPDSRRPGVAPLPAAAPGMAFGAPADEYWAAARLGPAACALANRTRPIER